MCPEGVWPVMGNSTTREYPAGLDRDQSRKENEKEERRGEERFCGQMYSSGYT